MYPEKPAHVSINLCDLRPSMARVKGKIEKDLAAAARWADHGDSTASIGALHTAWECWR
jgi:hypothetical protein